MRFLSACFAMKDVPQRRPASEDLEEWPKMKKQGFRWKLTHVEIWVWVFVVLSWIYMIIAHPPVGPKIPCKPIYVWTMAVGVGWVPGKYVTPDISKFKLCTVCPRTNRNEKSLTARLHTGHSYITHSFLLKGEEPPMCIGCNERLTIKYRIN